jgi:hypothetical protein
VPAVGAHGERLLKRQPLPVAMRPWHRGSEMVSLQIAPSTKHPLTTETPTPLSSGDVAAWCAGD